MGRSTDSHHPSLCLWIYCAWDWPPAPRLACRVHTHACCQRLYDWLCYKYSCRSGSWPYGHHWVQVSTVVLNGSNFADTFHSTRAATYEVIINTLKGLPITTLDAAWGLPGLFTLYAVRIICDQLSKRYPNKSKLNTCCVPCATLFNGICIGRVFFFISVARNAFVVIVLTIAAWLYCRAHKTASGKYPIKILQTVPAGFQDVGPPNIDSALVQALAPQIPVATIILLLEHIAIAKCESLTIYHLVFLTQYLQHLDGLMDTKSIQTRSLLPLVSQTRSALCSMLIPPRDRFPVQL